MHRVLNAVPFSIRGNFAVVGGGRGAAWRRVEQSRGRAVAQSGRGQGAVGRPGVVRGDGSKEARGVMREGE